MPRFFFKFKSSIKLATRSYQFTVELDMAVNSMPPFSFLASLTCCTPFRLYVFLSTSKIKSNINRYLMPSWLLFSYYRSLVMFLLLTLPQPVPLVALLPFLGWTRLKNIYWFLFHFCNRIPLYFGLQLKVERILWTIAKQMLKKKCIS